MRSSRARAGRRCDVGALAVAAALTAGIAGTQTPAPAIEPPRPVFSVRTSLKGTLLAFRAPDAPVFFPERNGVETAARVRIEPEIAVGTGSFAVAYEQRVQYASSGNPIATGAILQAGGRQAFRIRPLDWLIAESSGVSWRHEIDRASLRLPLGRVHLIAGRQAIGWGRGVMFGAVDLFAPFSPLDADREWRRGIDAVRADIKAGDRSSIEAIAAFGETWDESALVARARGYAGRVDLELMGGRRATDLVAGLSSSAAVGDAEIHGEAAGFWPRTGPNGRGPAVWKAVAGGSSRFPLGNGLLLYAEYHYSGFGLRRARDIAAALRDPAFAARYLRADTQILTRHAVAVLGTYEWSADVAVTGRWVHNPIDRSGIVAPAATVVFSDRLSALAAAYFPYGRPPSEAWFESEYGAVPWAGLIQLRLHFQR